MSNVTPFSSTTQTLNYKHGDIVRALVKGLQHEGIAADIERVLHDALFYPPHDESEQLGILDDASNTLYNLLNASLD